ncbi:MAG: alpha/beta fold hydrolase [Elusimicrobia bacterium]|nr:alpha/beta fold hydrolase [Elusimicrobiota bacterium]
MNGAILSAALASAAWAAGGAGAGQSVRLETSDGWTIPAVYRRAGSGTAVVLAHGLAAGKDEWKPLAEALAKRGVSTLAIDLRGHSESALRGKKVSFREFSDRGPDGEWARMHNDVVAAARYLAGKGHRSLGAAGASLGANVVMKAAAREPALAFVALLSPGLDYQGIHLADAVRDYGPRPLLVAASQRDAYARATCEELRRFRESLRLPVEWIEAKDGHGAQMFRETAVLEKTAAWLADPSSHVSSPR